MFKFSLNCFEFSIKCAPGKNPRNCQIVKLSNCVQNDELYKHKADALQVTQLS